MTFRDKVLKIVAGIPAGSVLTYKEVARMAGRSNAQRAVGNILNKNRNPGIPCHRVIKSDGFVGGYNRGSAEKIAKLLREGCIGVMPTDTIYGLVGSALSAKAVERIYRVRKRNVKKPMIILIASFKDLRRFGIELDLKTKVILKKVWPGKVSVILPCRRRKFFYLHRGTKFLAFRIPAVKSLREFLTKSGPLVAPSANPEGAAPAMTVNRAKKYFGQTIDFYLGDGVMSSVPSTLIKIERGRISIERPGADLKRVEEILSK